MNIQDKSQVKKLLEEQKNCMGKIGRKALVKTVQRIYNSQDKARCAAIKKSIRDLKGERITYAFTCKLCKHTRMAGYLYETEEGEYEICKFCYDSIHHTSPYVKVVYTPMGNKR